jgi:hypothetical protein
MTRKILFLLLIAQIGYAQRARVFENLLVSTSVGENSIVPSVGYIQTVTFGMNHNYRIKAGYRYSRYFTAKTDLESNTNASKLSLKKNVASSSINMPLGFEIGSEKIAIGILADVIGFSTSKFRDTSYFSVPLAKPIENLVIRNSSFNFLLSGSGSLNSELYVSFTPQPNVTIKAGLAATQVSYRTSYLTTDEQRVKLDRYVQNSVSPFLGLQFNFEK